MLFSDLGLSAELLRAVQTQGYGRPTAIQQQAIPPILAGLDVLASAQTGTGKTAGFMLPLLERLRAEPAADKHRRPSVLILTPTRELAQQVAESARAYGRHLAVKTTTIYGGVGIHPQIGALRRGVDIVVATPGRLLDHMQQRTIDLSGIRTLVLDEADRMLDMGFIRDIRRILANVPKRRQTLMFSATFSPEIRALADDFLHNPTEITATPRNTAVERVEQIVHRVDKSRKRELLSHRIGAENWRQVLVFTRTKHGADRLARQLDQDGLRATAIHGRKTQSARTRSLADFKAGKIRVLVATDIAARGLDIERLPHVVNFELPEVPEDYLHRIGRTARAGERGQAVSLVSAEELKLLRAIERLLKTELTQQAVAGYEIGPRQGADPRPDRSRMEPRGKPDERARGGTGKEHGGPARDRAGAGRRRKSPRRGGIKGRSSDTRSGGGSR
jgi:ATP-dependent RNA helicase RhlE